MESLKATLTIDSETQSVAYDPMIFGGFLEHFDNQIYGGIFEPGSLLADKSGFRIDVLEALKEFKVPVIRWPGGCFVDSYHWRKGIGENRIPYDDYRWGTVEPNSFGTHEFVDLCRRIGAEPYICHNGVCDPKENIDWVDYCNATEGPMAELRKKNGYSEPLNVKFWSVGNERYDKEYVDRVHDTAKVMKAFDPTVQITCSGSQDGSRIKSYLIDTAGELLDYVSVHNYWLNRGKTLPRHDYLTAISKSEMPEDYIKEVITSLEQEGRGGIKIAFDEWNLRAWQHPGFPRDSIEGYGSPELKAFIKQRVDENDLAEQYTMADALFSASFLNTCLRHADHVTMANIAPLVNTRGPLFVHPEGIVKRTHFHALSMYANFLQSQVATSVVHSDKLNGTPVSTIDAIATVDKSGKQWAIALINRHPSTSVECAVNMRNIIIDGIYKAIVLTGKSPDSFNDIEHPDRVMPIETQLIFKNGIASLRPHSLTIVHVSAEK
jgi:alpha-L-arabinofuranosidase